MNRWLLTGLVAAGMIAQCQAAPAQSASARGERLVLAHCAMCHATGNAGRSPNPQAPSLARIGDAALRRLGESLRSGSLGGHPEMPAFRFSLREADAVIQYLESIQRP